MLVLLKHLCVHFEPLHGFLRGKKKDRRPARVEHQQAAMFLTPFSRCPADFPSYQFTYAQSTVSIITCERKMLFVFIQTCQNNSLFSEQKLRKNENVKGILFIMALSLDVRNSSSATTAKIKVKD